MDVLVESLVKAREKVEHLCLISNIERAGDNFLAPRPNKTQISSVAASTP